jgi:two-component system, NarL family, nitrate/nitrite response regulator NarL
MEQRHPKPRIRIAIVDIHPIFRDALKHLFELEPDFDVVGEGTSTVDALRIASVTRPDVLLLDVAPPKVDGLAVLARFPHGATRVILLAAAIVEDDIVRALQLGARGVVLKGSATRFLIDGIRAVMNERYVIGSDVLDDLAHALATTRTPVAPPFRLTRREFEISMAVAAGATNREVAHNLSISVQTVKHHLTNIFEKTGVSTRLELMVFAVNHDFITRGGRRPPRSGHAKEVSR